MLLIPIVNHEEQQFQQIPHMICLSTLFVAKRHVENGRAIFCVTFKSHYGPSVTRSRSFRRHEIEPLRQNGYRVPLHSQVLHRSHRHSEAMRLEGSRNVSLMTLRLWCSTWPCATGGWKVSMEASFAGAPNHLACMRCCHCAVGLDTLSGALLIAAIHIQTTVRQLKTD